MNFTRTAFFLALVASSQPALGQVAVSIDRESLSLVGSAGGCPEDAVIFVTDQAAVRPVCTRPPAQELERASGDASQTVIGGTLAKPSASPPAPTWVALAGAPVQATLRTWLPAGWELKWDTTRDPRGPSVQVRGDFIDAVKALSATRQSWTSGGGEEGALLQVLAFPKQKIIQVRESDSPRVSSLPASTTAPGALVGEGRAN